MTSQLLDRLFALETFGIKLGLDNITTLCEALGHPERSFSSLHVAGTNGKGSVTAMAHAALRAAVQTEVDRQCGPVQVPVRYPPLALCTDNAAMIAGAACFALRRGVQAGWEADIHPRLPLTS